MSIEISTILIEGHEKVIRFQNKNIGLTGFISIHSTLKGPALGGIRVVPYASEEEALADGLRLSQAMTTKCALAGVSFGGGKTTVIGNPKSVKSKEFLHTIGRAVDSLQGRYICAEDSGICPSDVETIHEVTPYVVGLPGEKGSGNPAIFTAWGVLRAMEATLMFLDKNSSLEGKRVAIQGTGAVGRELAQFLFWKGAKLIITDIDPKSARQVQIKYGAEVVGLEEIFEVPCDIFAPCALGGILSLNNISKLQCRAIVGAANNQLPFMHEGDLLKQMNILHAPEVVGNCGGVINVSFERSLLGYRPEASRNLTSLIYDRMLQVYDLAKAQNISPYRAALLLADLQLSTPKTHAPTAVYC